MAYLLDTDIFLYLLKDHQGVRAQIEMVGPENVFLSSISVGELYFGAFNSQRVESNLKDLKKNLEDKQILNFTRNTAKIFGRLRAELRKKGTPVSDFDLAIASIALHHECILATHNTRHFEKIPELTLEDWIS